MKRISALALLPLLIASCTDDAEVSTMQTYRLHYDRPAEFFEESLPLGNGQLGALVYGGVAEEKISLNDITLWTGEPDLTPWTPDAWKHLAEVRRLLDKEDYAAAEEANKKLQGHNSEIYQALGTLLLCDLGAQKQIADDKLQITGAYERSLSLNDAMATVQYAVGEGSTMLRQCFVSAPDSVLVLRLSTTGDEPLNYRIGLNTLLPHATQSQGHTLCTEGYAAYSTKPEADKNEWFHYDENRGIHFRTELRVQAPEGCVKAESDSTLRIEGCHEATLLLTNVTSFNGPYRDPVREGRDYRSAVKERLDRAELIPYEVLLERHKTDHQALFNRMSIDLGTTDANLSQMATDEQLLAYSEAYEELITDDKLQITDPADDGEEVICNPNSVFNPDLEELYFQYGRYLLISSSRTEGVPANLQGLWNETLTPPWSGNYTVNINVEENYWPAEVTALPEMHNSLLTWIEQMPRSGAITAANYYGVIAPAWCLCHNSDIWCMTNPVGYQKESPEWACWPMGEAWVSTHLWEHYSFTQDLDFLSRVYPIMKGAVSFLQQWMVEKDGCLITSPSTSPENHYITDKGVNASTLYGGTADLAMIRELLIDTRKAALVLAADSNTPFGSIRYANEGAYADSLLQMICQLRPYQIGQKGNLQEWYYDWEDADPRHRHQSHLFGLYPGHHINAFDTPDLMQACAKSLEIKGDQTTGWSAGWRVNLQARLGDGEAAYHILRKLLRYVSPEGRDDPRKQWGGGGTYPNLFDAHPPFQIDGNFGGTAGMAEMLVQSTDEGLVRLLPALPDAWTREGTIRGVRLRGGYELTMTWRNGQVTRLEIKSLRRDDGTLTIQMPGQEITVEVKAGQLAKVV